MNKLNLPELNKDTYELREKEKIPMPVLVRGTHIIEDFDESIIKE